MKRAMLMLISGMIGISILNSCGKTTVPYLPAIQTTLNCLIHNDEEEYLNTRQPKIKEAYEQVRNTSDETTIISDFYEQLLEYNAVNEIKNIKIVDTIEGDTAEKGFDILREMDDHILKNYGIEANINFEPREVHWVTFEMPVKNAPSDSVINARCLVYKFDDEWYVDFFDNSFSLNVKEEKNRIEESTSIVEQTSSEDTQNSEYPYLPAIQKSLDCIFNNDEEGYWNAQHSEFKRWHDTYPELYYDDTVEDGYKVISKKYLTNNISNLKEVTTFKNRTTEETIKDEIGWRNEQLKEPMDIDIKESKFVEFYLDSENSDQESIRFVCMVYQVNNQWYAKFWDGSIDTDD